MDIQRFDTSDIYPSEAVAIRQQTMATTTPGFALLSSVRLHRRSRYSNKPAFHDMYVCVPAPPQHTQITYIYTHAFNVIYAAVTWILGTEQCQASSGEKENRFTLQRNEPSNIITKSHDVSPSMTLCHLSLDFPRKVLKVVWESFLLSYKLT